VHLDGTITHNQLTDDVMTNMTANQIKNFISVVSGHLDLTEPSLSFGESWGILLCTMVDLEGGIRSKFIPAVGRVEAANSRLDTVNKVSTCTG
jgi:hypothetical protein